MKNKYHKKIVVIGGGTGTFTVLRGCKEFPFDVTAVVSTADDGGSSGILRDELGVLPPGDIRQSLVALSQDSSILRDLFNYRFSQGSLKGHQFGNLFLSALEKVTGRFDQAVLEAGKILAIKGQVIPVTNDNVHLVGKNAKGNLVKGQHTIDQYIWSDQSPIEDLWLEPKSSIHPEVKKAIESADIIVLGPGSLYTSIIPNLLVDGMTSALEKTTAQLVYVVNLMTEKGQTKAFSVQDYADVIKRYLGNRSIDYVIYNTKKPSRTLLDHYRQEMERKPVEIDDARQTKVGYSLIGARLLASQPPHLSKDDQLASTRSLIRHDSFRLAQVLYYLSLGHDFTSLDLKEN